MRETGAISGSSTSRWLPLGQSFILKIICLAHHGDGEGSDAPILYSPCWRSEETVFQSSAAPKGFHRPMFLIFLELALRSSYYSKDQLRIAVKVVFVVFISLGCVRRRQVRSSPLWLLRFGDEDPSVLSSVKLPRHLHLNFQPRGLAPSQWLVEPLAIWLAGLCEALDDHICRCCKSMILMDNLVGSFVFFGEGSFQLYFSLVCR